MRKISILFNTFNIEKNSHTNGHRFFKKLGIDEWDSFCGKCIMFYSKKSDDTWEKSKV